MWYKLPDEIRCQTTTHRQTMKHYHVLCKNAGAYCTMLEEKLRKLFAKELNIAAD
jgi:hypothetical protein